MSSPSDSAAAALGDSTDPKKAGLTRSDSLELPGVPEDSTTERDDDTADLPPGRMHAIRVPERLSGSNSSLHIPAALQQSLVNKQGTSGRDRSKSPSIRSQTAATTGDANSSISSLDDIIDQDILYDRQGLVELDLTESQRRLHNSREFGSSNGFLPAVNERLSEDTLEDVHAFSDVARSSNASRVSIGTDPVLEPLDECGEEEEDDLDGDDLDDIAEGDEYGAAAHSSGANTTTVILTNMENLTLQQDAAQKQEEDALAMAEESAGGESSFLGER